MPLIHQKFKNMYICLTKSVAINIEQSFLVSVTLAILS